MSNLFFAPAPHLKKKSTVSDAMRDVMLALVPITAVSIYFFKMYAVFLIVVCMATAAITEILFRAYMKKKATLQDGSALLTGLLVALCFSPTTLWWTAAMATFIAVGIAKELMGGLGWNRFNPALFGRVAMIIAAPFFLTISNLFAQWRVNFGSIDLVSQATPLAMLQSGMEMPSIWRMFIAFPGGALSETSALALLIGGAYLIYKEHINWRIPASFIGTVFVLTLILGQNPVYHILSGGIFLGAFFMATDWVTSPITNKGKLIFGVCIGVLVVLFRVVLAPTEGVAFSILIMNAFVPMIERMTKRPSFSEPKPVPAPSAGQQQSVKA